MEEKSEDNLFQINDNYINLQKKLTNNIHCESHKSEIITTEDIFIKLKEEIKTIKKKQLEMKKIRENYKRKTNLKSIQINKNKNNNKNLTSYNTLNSLNSLHSLNSLTSNKTDNKMAKSNSSNYKIFKVKNKNYLTNNMKDNKAKLNYNINTNKSQFSNNNKDLFNNEDDNDNNNKDLFNNEDDNDNDNNNEAYIDKDTINNSSRNMIIKNFDEDEIDFLSLSNNDFFEKCECVIRGKDENNCDENFIPIINENWKKIQNITNFDFSKNVLKTKDVIDYNAKGVEINIHLKLYEQSSFFIFTRCYVDDSNEFNYDNSINSIKKCKSQSLYDISRNKYNIIFSKYSTVIKIYKSNNSNKVFVSFGTFCRNKKNGILQYKTFLQRQLVDYLHQDNNYYYLENDLCEFDIIIIDIGNEQLVAKISLNNKEKYNIIKSNFFLPINKKAKLMFCGEGKSAKVMDLKIRSFDKNNEDTEKGGLLMSEEKKNCDCCLLQ